MKVAKLGPATDAHQLLVTVTGARIVNGRHVVVDGLRESGRAGIGLVFVSGVEQVSAAPDTEVAARFEVVPERIVEIGIVRPFDRYAILLRRQDSSPLRIGPFAL